jgi:hypothetical protein
MARCSFPRRLIATFGICGTAAVLGCGDPIRPVAPDTTPPATPVLSVALTATTSSSVRLRWTAVGDDGMTGTATSYELRYQLDSSFPQANFNQGTIAPGMFAPHTPGTPESLTVSGLLADTVYTFLMRVKDDAGYGRFSNAPSARTLR